MEAEAPPKPARRTVAVCFSGWIGRGVPGAGQSAKQHLIDTLAADAFLAATYAETDCPDRRGDCLLDRVSRLQPLTGLLLEPMLTHAQLVANVSSFPQFATVAAAYNRKTNFKGLNVFAPVLGNRKLSVLRQLHDYWRVFKMVVAQETHRRRRYDRLVHARLEMMWLAAHVPLSLLSDRLIWVPPTGGVDGVSDRHAVVPRSYARFYFGRWALLRSRTLLDKVPLEALTHDDPERFLQNVLVSAGVPVGVFPFTAFLGCCAGSAGCWRSECHEMPLRAPEATCIDAIGLAETSPLLRRADGWPVHDVARQGCVAAGKSMGEVREAVLNWRWLQCAGLRLLAYHVAGTVQRREEMGVSGADWARRFGKRTTEWRPVQAKVELSVPTNSRSSAYDSETEEFKRTKQIRSLLVRIVSPDGSRAPLLWPEAKITGGHRLGSIKQTSGPAPRTRTRASVSAEAACPLHKPKVASGNETAGWLALAVPGYCNTASTGADCSADSQGAFSLPDEDVISWEAAAAACLRMCHGCERCRHISVSLHWRDCSWFHSCERVQKTAVGLLHFRTAKVQRLPSGDLNGGAGLSDRSRRQAKRIGSEYGGWTFDNSLLTTDSVIYSFGLGTDISWDLELISMTSCHVHGFDDTPGSNAFLRKQRRSGLLPRKFHWHRCVLSDSDGEMTMRLPTGYQRSYAAHRVGARSAKGALEVRARAHSLQSIMACLNHTRIDLMKMDIEGSEFFILDGPAGPPRLPVCQLLIEFHGRLSRPRAKTNALRALTSAGFEVIRQEARPDGADNALLMNSRFCRRGQEPESASVVASVPRAPDSCFQPVELSSLPDKGSRVRANEWLANARTGHCGATQVGEGDCETNDFGSFADPALSQAMRTTAGSSQRSGPVARAAQACIAQCARCQRCRFVSMLIGPQPDCSWYSHCELGRLASGGPFVKGQLLSGSVF